MLQRFHESGRLWLDNGKTPRIEDLTGLWTRSLLEFPDGRRDTATSVAWLQAGTRYADLRQPPGLPGFPHAAGLDDLSAEDCAHLATQSGFAGLLRAVGDCVEWVRKIDFQPPGPVKDIGRLVWQGDVLVETGRDVEYLEHWHRASDVLAGHFLALDLLAEDDDRVGYLVVAGGLFMYARDRVAALPAGETLAECIAAAPDLAAARDMLDCEISLGQADGDWQIARSTHPFRAGGLLAPVLVGERLTVAERDRAGGSVSRHWRVGAAEGDQRILSP